MSPSTGHSHELYCTKSILPGVRDIDLIATVEFGLLHAIAVCTALTLIASLCAFGFFYGMPVSSQHNPLVFWTPHRSFDGLLPINHQIAEIPEIFCCIKFNNKVFFYFWAFSILIYRPIATKPNTLAGQRTIRLGNNDSVPDIASICEILCKRSRPNHKICQKATMNGHIRLGKGDSGHPQKTHCCEPFCGTMGTASVPRSVGALGPLGARDTDHIEHNSSNINVVGSIVGKPLRELCTLRFGVLAPDAEISRHSVFRNLQSHNYTATRAVTIHTMLCFVAGNEPTVTIKCKFQHIGVPPFLDNKENDSGLGHNNPISLSFVFSFL